MCIMPSVILAIGSCPAVALCVCYKTVSMVGIYIDWTMQVVFWLLVYNCNNGVTQCTGAHMNQQCFPEWATGMDFPHEDISSYSYY